MNIFLTSTDPILAAQALDDKRLVKMVLETAQIICTATGIGPYRPTHQHHPVVKWAGEHPSHTWWTIRHFWALSREYAYRYGRTHLSATKCKQPLLDFVRKVRPYSYGTPTHWQNSAAHSTLDLSFKHISPTTLAYKHYLCARWATDTRTPAWTKRNPPSWLKITETPNVPS